MTIKEELGLRKGEVALEKDHMICDLITQVATIKEAQQMLGAELRAATQATLSDNQ